MEIFFLLKELMGHLIIIDSKVSILILSRGTETTRSMRRSGIYEMLQYFGYSNNKQISRKKAIVIVNLISPMIEYKSYGKTVIDFEPFEDAIADTIKKVCSNRGPSIKGI